MTQRTNGFKAGIQAGTTAYDAVSLRLDSLVKSTGKSLGGTLDTGLWVPSISAAQLGSRLGSLGGVGMAPDGGIYLQEDLETPLLVVEAKKQGPVGNAIERMFKNIQISKMIGTKKYLILATGSGFFENNSAERISRTALGCYNEAGGYDFGSHNSFLEIHRFDESALTSEMIREIVESTLLNANGRPNDA